MVISCTDETQWLIIVWQSCNGADPLTSSVLIEWLAVDASHNGRATRCASKCRASLVERDDFSSGTSSKSTKLVHGGVRYLEKAVWNLDYNQ